MTFVELIEKVAKKTGLPKEQVAKVLHTFLGEVKGALGLGNEVQLRGFGTFYSRILPDRSLFGGTRMSGGRRSIRFRQSRRTS